MMLSFLSLLLVTPAEPWFKSLVWTDYRVAVLFTVLIPLVLLIWAFVQKNEPVQRLLTIYWRVASLLAITVYLMIAAFPMSFLAGFLARVLIPVCLWFWVDLNEELEDLSSSLLKFCFQAWRWAVSVYSLIGALCLIPFVRCALDSQLLGSRFCQVWFDPPLLYKQYFHNNTSVALLGFLGILALIFYLFCLGYFVFFRLGKQGRSATGH